MEATVTKNRLHPLLTAAAVSVTVFSAVGVGAITGVLPSSIGSSRDAAPLVTSAAPAPAAATMPQAAPVQHVAPAMPAAPAVTPAPKPVKKVQPAAPRSAEPAVYREYEPSPRVAQAPVYAPPPPVVAEAPKPVPAGALGIVESVREVAQPGEHTAMGPIAGGIAGAVLGNQFGNGTGKKIMTVVGAAGGAFAGREIERHARGTKSWEITLRMDDGTQRTLTSATQPHWASGDRVRLVDGRLQPV